MFILHLYTIYKIEKLEDVKIGLYVIEKGNKNFN